MPSLTKSPVAALIARSNALGSDPKNTNYAGGNTSAKGTETDPVTGDDVELLWWASPPLSCASTPAA